MSDLFDDARPIRDAAMKEITRLLEDDASSDRDANILSVHLIALMMTFVVNRHGVTSGQVRDQGLHQMLAGAFAELIANAAMGFRPLNSGQPISASLNAMMLLDLIAGKTLEQVSIHESGLHDFVIPFHRAEGGAIEVKPFDFAEILKGKP